MKNIENTDIVLSEGDRKIGTFLVFSYLFFNYVRPQEFIPGLSEIRVAGLLFLLTTIWGIFHIRGHIFRTPIILVLVIGVLFFLSGIGAVNVSSYKASIKYIFEVFPQCVAIFLIFDSKERIHRLIHLWCVIYFLMAIITIGQGGVGPGAFLWDPNDISLALAMGIPWCVYSLRFLDLTKKQRYFHWAVFALLVAAIIITRSRGGFLGLIAVFLLLWWFSHKRLKFAFIGIVSAVLLGGVLLSVLPDGYLDEMKSISNTEDETRVERFRTWEIAWIMYKDNPVVGVGAGNFAYNAGYYQKLTPTWTGEEKSLQGRVTHSLYFQVLSELGTFGALIYLYIIIVLPLKLYRLWNSFDEDIENERLVKMFALILIVSMGAYAVAGAFISVAYYPHIPIWITMYAIFKRYAGSVKRSRESINTA